MASETNENTLIALAKLDDIIRDPVSRQQFQEDPYATAREAGIDLDDVPPPIWQALIEMSLDELGAVAVLGNALAEAGLFDGEHAWHFVV
ncbi:MAG TPA: hypothetical protein VH641_21230 [Streptosporangiaceae bacterium]|jgi:hypothetical protein